jgi:hypothetical protein
MIKGLFVPNWSLHTGKDCDDMLAWCIKYGITDVYYLTGRIDKTILDGRVIDFLDYICRNKGSLKIHAHYSALLLWRKQNWLTPEERPLIKDDWLYFNGRNMCFELDSTNKEVQDYLVEQTLKLVTENDVDGLYLERLYYHPVGIGKGTKDDKKNALTKILSEITKECKKIKPTLIVSVATWIFDPNLIPSTNPKIVRDFDRLQEVDKWETIADYIMPMAFYTGGKFDIISPLIKKAKYIPTVGCYNLTLAETSRQLKEFGNVAYYSYAKFSSDAVSRDDFGEVINAK